LLNGKLRAACPGGQAREQSRSARAQTWTLPDAPQPAAVKRAAFTAGMRVRHSIWGEGIVLNSKIQDEDETVDVFFESVGMKRLAASLANLKVVSHQ